MHCPKTDRRQEAHHQQRRPKRLGRGHCMIWWYPYTYSVQHISTRTLQLTAGPAHYASHTVLPAECSFQTISCNCIQSTYSSIHILLPTTPFSMYKRRAAWATDHRSFLSRSCQLLLLRTPTTSPSDDIYTQRYLCAPYLTQSRYVLLLICIAEAVKPPIVITIIHRDQHRASAHYRWTVQSMYILYSIIIIITTTTSRSPTRRLQSLLAINDEMMAWLCLGARQPSTTPHPLGPGPPNSYYHHDYISTSSRTDHTHLLYAEYITVIPSTIAIPFQMRTCSYIYMYE